MSAPSDPAYPRIEQIEDYSNGIHGVSGPCGMTIRQRFVLAAMQGILSSWPQDKWLPNSGYDQLAAQAVKFADATLSAERESRG